MNQTVMKCAEYAQNMPDKVVLQCVKRQSQTTFIGAIAIASIVFAAAFVCLVYVAYLFFIRDRKDDCATWPFAIVAVISALLIAYVIYVMYCNTQMIEHVLCYTLGRASK